MIQFYHFQVLSFIMYETYLGPKTQLETYDGNHLKICFGPSENIAQSHPLPNKHPGLVAISECG